MITTRRLDESDRDALVGFLQSAPDETMFLQGNFEHSGFVDEPRRYCALYVGGFDATGTLCGVAAACWNKNYIVYAPTGAAEIVDAAWRIRGDVMAMVLGPHAQIQAVLKGLGLTDVPTAIRGREVLYSLELDRLRVPNALSECRVTSRMATTEDLDVVAPWFEGYAREALGIQGEGADWSAGVRERAKGQIERNNVWLLLDDGVPVSKTEFNTRTSTCVQVGGVWTPPELRSRGYAAAVVAASLLDMQREGKTRSVLFTPEENAPARRCYEGLGYEEAGDYCVHGFAEPVSRNRGS